MKHIPSNIQDKDSEELAEYLEYILRENGYSNVRCETKSVTHIIGDCFQTIILIKESESIYIVNYFMMGGYLHELDSIRKFR